MSLNTIEKIINTERGVELKEERKEREVLKRIGQRLRSLRVEKGMTQLELGEALGVAQGTIGFYESGARSMTISNAIQLADFFDVSVEYLLCQSDVRDKTSVLQDFEDPDIRYIARGIKDRKEAEKLRKVAEALFPESFKI